MVPSIEVISFDVTRTMTTRVIAMKNVWYVNDASRPNEQNGRTFDGHGCMMHTQSNKINRVCSWCASIEYTGIDFPTILTLKDKQTHR